MMLALFIIVATCLIALTQGRMLNQKFREHVLGQEVRGLNRELADAFCTNPIAKQLVKFPESLTGRTTPPVMYSG